MVVTLPPLGTKCQVGDFTLLIDPASVSSFAKAIKDKKTSEGKSEKKDSFTVASTKAGNLILKTETDLPLASSSPLGLIEGPGEYEIQGTKVKAINFQEENTTRRALRTAYLVELEGMRLAFLGELKSEPSEEPLDKLGEVDILFFSADQEKLKAKQLVSLVKQIDPRIVVPLTDKLAKSLAEELGQRIGAEEKLVIKRKDLLKEEAINKVVWLKRKAR